MKDTVKRIAADQAVKAVREQLQHLTDEELDTITAAVKTAVSVAIEIADRL